MKFSAVQYWNLQYLNFERSHDLFEASLHFLEILEIIRYSVLADWEFFKKSLQL